MYLLLNDSWACAYVDPTNTPSGLAEVAAPLPRRAIELSTVMPACAMPLLAEETLFVCHDGNDGQYSQAADGSRIARGQTS